MSTEQEMGVSVCEPLALSVILDDPGSFRYFCLSGLCTERRSTAFPFLA
jgi:hypothetical protein